MALTSIGTQKTPGRPIELTFAGETGIPSANQELLLIGKLGASGGAGSGTASAYVLSQVNNAGDQTLGKAEAELKYGIGSELAKMVEAAIKANTGQGTVPTIKCIPLLDTDTDFGASDEALVAARNVKAEYIVSPFDGQDEALRSKLRDHAILVSGSQRVHNNQFGSFGVVANLAEQDPSNLDQFDTPAVIGCWYRVVDGTISYSVAEVAAACAARMAANVAPFNPLDDSDIVGLPVSTEDSDNISVGAGLESESCLSRGWTPVYVKANGQPAFVRTVTGRLSPDGTGTPLVTAYYDVQDFNVLYFWRKTLYTRFAQADFKRRKASDESGRLIKSEMIRLAGIFEGQEMFQAVDQLAKQFLVERNLQDRHRFDFKTPVNVIPGLHVIAGNIVATTEFDTITI